MSEENGVLDMDLSIGIAAFEAKHFGTATSLLVPWRILVTQKRNTAWQSWRRMV